MFLFSSPILTYHINHKTYQILSPPPQNVCHSNSKEDKQKVNILQFTKAFPVILRPIFFVCTIWQSLSVWTRSKNQDGGHNATEAPPILLAYWQSNKVCSPLFLYKTKEDFSHKVSQCFSNWVTLTSVNFNSQNFLAAAWQGSTQFVKMEYDLPSNLFMSFRPSPPLSPGIMTHRFQNN